MCALNEVKGMELFMAMIKCPNCNEDISDKSVKCVHCGKQLVEEPKIKQVSNKKKNKKIIIIAVSCILLVIVIWTLILSFGKGKVAKEGTEVKNILLRNNYKTYFTYGENNYDNSLLCYQYDYSKREDCERETDLWNFISINIVDNSNKKISFGGYVNLDDNNKITKITLNIEENAYDRDKVRNQYTISSNGEEDYYSSTDEDYNICHILKKSAELKKENLTPCSKTVESELNSFKNNYQQVMKNMGLNFEDFFSYFEWYANEYAIPQYKKAKKELENKMPYDSMLKNLSKEYKISIGNEQVMLIDYTTDTYYHAFYFLMDNDKVDTIGYKSSSNSDYILRYDVEDNYFYGHDEDNTCLFILSNDNGVKEQVDTGKYCSENDKKEIKYLSYDYDYQIKNTKLTLDEIILFAEEYYSKNK